MLKVLKVSGQSLSPEYQEGDFVVTVKIPLFLRPYQIGDIVVFKHPLYGMMIKQIQQTDTDRGEVFLAGTHPDSLDSRRFGWINQASLLGKVIWHVKKPRRQ